MPDEVADWLRDINDARSPVYLYRLGDRGFYAELTTVARAAIHAGTHEMRLVIDSRDFAYRRERGWSDYFEPVVADLADDADLADTARHGGMAVEIDCRSVVRGPGTPFDALIAHRPQSVTFGSTTVEGFQAVLGTAFRAAFRPNEPTSREIARLKAACDLPERYTSLHIRRGDKVGDEDRQYPADLYLRHLESRGLADLPVFTLSDDYRSVVEVRSALGRHRSPVATFTLCEEQHRGFSIHAMRRQPARDRDQVASETIRLLAETVIAAGSECFVGTFRSNVSKSVWYLHEQPDNCVLMRPGESTRPR